MIPLKWILTGAAVLGVGALIGSSVLDDKYREEERKKWLDQLSKCGKCGTEHKNRDLSQIALSSIFEKYGHKMPDGYIFGEYAGLSYCSVCCKEIESQIENKIIYADSVYNGITYYPTTYQGRIPKKSSSEIEESTVNGYENKDDAIKELKFMAALKGYDLIYDLSYYFETCEESNGYIYKIWFCKGIFSNKK